MTAALIYHVASGQAFFSGAALIALAVLLSVRPAGRWKSLGRTVSACTGMILVAASATPLPVGLDVLGGVVTLVWLVAEGSTGARGRRAKPWLRVGVLAVWGLGAGLELPYHALPAVPRMDDPPVYVVGDSLAAGMGGEAVTWPKLLASEHGLLIHDLSRSGATVASADREVAGHLTDPGALVLAEIGGNDVLSGTTPEAFETALDQLLRRLGAGGRRVVMFELPLPPFFNRYGAIQRRQARRHGVFLVPKRVLLGVLTGRGTTLDTIHLSRAGHERMARAVSRVIRAAFVSRHTVGQAAG